MSELKSEKVIVAAPLSYTGSAQRIWRVSDNPFIRWGILLCLIVFAWIFITVWYLFWGLWLVPYRLIRRSDRNRKRQKLQHRELLEAVKNNNEVK
jgi:Flp pilus assembly protein TadB